MTDAAVNIAVEDPASYKALIALSGAADAGAVAAGISPLLVDLIKIRTSQINGCAFCLRMHTRDSVAKGETVDRLAVLPAWRESNYFDATERAALALAEGVTTLDDPTGSAVEQEGDADALTSAQHAAVVWLTTVMNAFNRVAISSQYDVSPG